MNAKLKKGLTIGLSVFAAILVLLMVLPFVFRGKIMSIAKTEMNKKMNARVDFDKVDMSFIRSFPHASVQLENLRIVGVGEFSNDTLLSCGNIDLVLNLKSLFSDSGYEIRKFQINDSRILAHVLPNGKVNWDIMKPDSTQEEPVDTTKSNFKMKLQDFVINHADVTYWDEVGNMKAVLKNINHRSSGDMTADVTLLKTHTTIDSLSFSMDKISYLTKAQIEMDADIDANLKDMKFTFSKNSSRLNAIEFAFGGWVKMLDEGFDMDLTLNAEKVDFKSILSLIPAVYATNFEGVKAGGAVKMSGFMKGEMIGDKYPTFDFKLLAENGWFQYPALPQSLKNINLAVQIFNPGKTLDATVIDISKFSFLMAGNPFSAQMRVAYPMSDPELMMKAIGKLDLGKIKDLYPLEADTHLNGVLDMNMDLAGRMSYYETNQYDQFKFGGKLNISNMLVKMKALPQDVSISQANLLFNNRYADLTTLQMKIGRNDLTANGKLENFVAYALSNKTLKGTLNVSSNYMNVSDFMAPSTQPATADTTKLTVIEVPKNIDFTMSANFKKLDYDKMTFTNAKGVLKVLDGEVKIQNAGLQAFGGNMTLAGVYSTKEPQKPSINFDMGVNEVLFTEMFKQVDMMKKFAPVFEKASGRFNMKLAFTSLLKKDMMPEMNSVVGNGSFSTKSIGLNNVGVLSTLASKLKRPDLANPTLKDLSVSFDIKDGKITTKPFNVNLGDIKMNLGGTTGLDQSIAYVGKVQMPDKYNLGKLSAVNLKIGGTFTKPSVSLDLSSTLNSLVSDVKAKVTTEVNKQVDAAKVKAAEEVKKQKENALKAAQQEADRIRAEAQKLGEQLVAEAQKQGDALVAKASNPITKKIAQAASKKLVDEATKKAAALNSKAETEAQNLLSKAAEL